MVYLLNSLLTAGIIVQASVFPGGSVTLNQHKNIKEWGIIC